MNPPQTAPANDEIRRDALRDCAAARRRFEGSIRDVEVAAP
jgi:hypothetical protein